MAGAGAARALAETGANEGRAALVARVLAAVGGYVDGVGFVALLGLFTAHQSGNSAGLGAALGGGEWGQVWRRGLAIGAYLVGVGLGTFVVELGRSRGVRSTGALVCVAEVAALGSALGLGAVAARSGRILPADTLSYALVATCLAGGMGLQTVSLRRVGSQTVRTTFVTGVVTEMSERLVATWFSPPGSRRQGRLRSWLLASVWLCYLVGAVAGGAAVRSWSLTSLAVPIVAVTAIAAWQFRRGYDPGLEGSAHAG